MLDCVKVATEGFWGFPYIAGVTDFTGDILTQTTYIPVNTPDEPDSCKVAVSMVCIRMSFNYYDKGYIVTLRPIDEGVEIEIWIDYNGDKDTYYVIERYEDQKEFRNTLVKHLVKCSLQ